MIGNFANIPAEMRALKQWCVWKYVDIGAKKPTKVPYQPNGVKCNVTDKETWSSFDNCFSAMATGNYNGMGFIFSADDPYSFIDLDDSEGDASIMERHLKIYHEFDSYAEISPSNQGLHLIVKGKVGVGRRRAKIEVYSQERYATMTGNIYGNRTQIKDCQSQLTQLWEQMGGENILKISDFKGAEKEEYSDEEIISQAARAVNGDKFQHLHSGQWKDLYSSQSEADFAYINMVSFYTRNTDQIKRLFHASPLGKRPKAKRLDYLQGMIQRSFDNVPAPIDFEGYKEALDKFKAGSVNGKPSDFDSENTGSIPVPASITVPPGLLGEIAKFIYAAAPRPVPEIALAGAIGLMAGICGRAYNYSGTGLNQYVLVLAKTGRGKEAAASGIDKLMNSIKLTCPTASRFRGPGIINSGQALTKHLNQTSNCFVSVLGEFGITIDRISNEFANSADKMLFSNLLDLYNKSGFGQTFQASIYSKKEDNIGMTERPALTILGESTHKLFYGCLNERMISAGLLPRFLIIEYNGYRVEMNENHNNVFPSFNLSETLGNLVAQCETVMSNNKAVDVKINDDALVLLRKFDKLSDHKINTASGDGVIDELWNRAHMKVQRLAALIAVGVSMYDPVITTDYVQWAIDLVQNDIRLLSSKFESGEIGANSTEILQLNEAKRILKEYVMKDTEYVLKYGANFHQHKNKVINNNYLNNRLSKLAVMRTDKLGGLAATKRTVQSLTDSGILIELKGKEYDIYKTTGRIWQIISIS